MFKILSIHYSQSGQLTEIIDQFLGPLESLENISIEKIKLEPVKDFPFPWTSDVFFNTMPESVLEEAIPIKPIAYKENKYDLIIIGYQPWFLSPSIPISSLLQDDTFLNVIKNTDVITIIGSRNMWLNSQESIKKRLFDAKANLIGNIPLYDKTNNSISAVTILYWMLSGKKERFLNLFPKPGVSEKDIDETKHYVEILKTKIKEQNLASIQNNFQSLKQFEVYTNLMFIETNGKRLFKIWANLIKSRGKSRKIFVSIYKYYLLVALFIVAPILLFFQNIFIFPFTKNKIQAKKRYFCGVELE